MRELLSASYAYYLANQERFWTEMSRHLILSGSALAISLIVCIPLGIWAARHTTIAQYVITAIGALRLIPSSLSERTVNSASQSQIGFFGIWLCDALNPTLSDRLLAWRSSFWCCPTSAPALARP